MVLYKITNKAPVSFIFWEALIIIDDQWLRKYEAHRRFIGEAVPCAIGLYRKRLMINGSKNMKVTGALLVKLCLTASASLPTSAMIPFTSFFIFFRFVTYTYVRTVVGTASDFLFNGCVHNLSA